MKTMCPERQILSIYFDGELDSPWKEKLENHLEGCSSCREHLTSYEVTRQKLSGTGVPEQTMEQAFDRVWEKSNLALSCYTVKASSAAKPRRQFWTGSITIPVPVAAAAGFVMALAMAVVITLKQPTKVIEPQLAGTGMEIQETFPVSDMAGFFQYLGSDNSPDMVIIQLPSKTFTNAGEPQMIQAADYSGSGGSR